ncbi:unnamed protein product [Protopolystoma xenopodis]|uniref:Uncharacterized protein n=1 Tax=Protopolystoma xenopodis TaxID=117903 RepID=A0A448WLP3_9PLAT|nr:unnamed protein product [Protopolystoma xenopodis]
MLRFVNKKTKSCHNKCVSGAAFLQRVCHAGTDDYRAGGTRTRGVLNRDLLYQMRPSHLPMSLPNNCTVEMSKSSLDWYWSCQLTSSGHSFNITPIRTDNPTSQPQVAPSVLFCPQDVRQHRRFELTASAA